MRVSVSILALLILIGVLIFGKKEGFKNVDFDARNQFEKILTKVLPTNAICARGAQCISGVCLETNNETTYGYCK